MSGDKILLEITLDAQGKSWEAVLESELSPMLIRSLLRRVVSRLESRDWEGRGNLEGEQR